MICRKCKKQIPDESVFCMFCGSNQTPPAPHPKRRGNGQGTIYKLPSGKYQAIVTLGYTTDENGKLHRKKRTKVFSTKRDAIAALPTLKTDIQPEDISLSILYNQYTQTTEYKNLSLSLRQRYDAAWKRWSPIEYRGIASLTVADIESQIKKASVSYYTAFEMSTLLSHLYKIAIKQEICQVNKTSSIDLPYETPKPKRLVWGKDDIAAFWAALPDHPFVAYILIMCYAGLRIGELSTIEIKNINLNESYMIGGIKSDAGIDRQIPIHAKIKPLIAELCQKNKKYLCEMSQRSFMRRYWETIAQLKVRHYPPHTCRHWYFSAMTAAGIQGGIIAEVGGHANFLTTLKNYVRIPFSDKLEAVNKI